MGGLFSLNALIEYPDIFGFAGCFSVHWIGIKPIDYFLLPLRMKVMLVVYRSIKEISKIFDQHLFWYFYG